MKSTFIILCIIILELSFSVFAEDNVVGIDLGTRILEEAEEADEQQTYYTVNITPEFEVWKLGVGLGFMAQFDEEGKFREEDWDSPNDYARILRYIRYGKKGDKIYGKIGALDSARIGNGLIMRNYSNQLDIFNRKVGLVLDLDFCHAGIETVFSDVMGA